MSAMLMAILLNNMSSEEIHYLTDAYIKSGKIIEFPESNGKFVDKHSTGGVGDKISTHLPPIIAACGLYEPMISGRGLGHTGGTLDKLESIPGFSTEIPIQKFKEIVKENGFAIVSQSEDIVPADRAIYALRDVSGTVESIPLITASIMSKKIASGIDGLVIDLKVGQGAFMENMEDAEKLARSLSEVGRNFGKKISVVFTNMNSPLGNCIGNGVEIQESIEFLKGNYTDDLKEITFALAIEMLIIGGIVSNSKEAEDKILEVIESGAALNKFRKFVELQGGDVNVIDDYSLLWSPESSIEIRAKSSGYISNIHAKKIGWALIHVNAGRKVLTDKIDHSAGMIFAKKVGDKVNQGEKIATLYFNNDKGKMVSEMIQDAITIAAKLVEKAPQILK